MVKKEKEIALEVKMVSKGFRLPTERASGIKQAFINRTRGIKGYKEQSVLKELNFEVKKGEFFGIVGRNGSGKSTLLKIISKIYEPDSGEVIINGSLVPFIELGVGFNPELTGRENIYMNGALLGFSTKEVDGMYEDIVDFAELHDFMDQKLKNYSSGMQVRLAFSIAIKAQGDILVLDEVLAVGDESFQKKCKDYFYKMKKQKKTVVLVTHSMEDVRLFCDKAALISNGKITKLGNPEEVANAYSDIFIREQEQQLAKDNSEVELIKSNEVELSSLKILVNNIEKQYIKHKENFKVSIDLNVYVDFDDYIFAINLINQEGHATLVASTDLLSRNANKLKKGKRRIVFNIQNVFPGGEYGVNVALAKKEKGSQSLVLKQEDIRRFEIGNPRLHKHGLTHPEVTVEVK